MLLPDALRDALAMEEVAAGEPADSGGVACRLGSTTERLEADAAALAVGRTSSTKEAEQLPPLRGCSRWENVVLEVHAHQLDIVVAISKARWWRVWRWQRVWRRRRAP